MACQASVPGVWWATRPHRGMSQGWPAGRCKRKLDSCSWLFTLLLLVFGIGALEGGQCFKQRSLGWLRPNFFFANNLALELLLLMCMFMWAAVST